MRDLQKVQFKTTGTREDGTVIYALWIDSEPVRQGLDIEDVIRILAERDEEEMPRRVPAAFRTPEDRRRYERRECPKAL